MSASTVEHAENQHSIVAFRSLFWFYGLHIDYRLSLIAFINPKYKTACRHFEACSYNFFKASKAMHKPKMADS